MAEPTLIDRLRARRTSGKWSDTLVRDVLCLEAADALEALTARNAELEQELRDALEAEDATKDGFWAVYPDYVRLGGKPLTEPLAQSKLSARAQTAEDRVKVLERLATDRRYMLDAYRNMLGENALKVVAIWDDRNTQRVHYSWTPAALALTGEERAKFILEWEAASVHAVRVDNIDRAALAPAQEGGE